MPDEAILRKLLSDKARRDIAWKAFLDQYSNLFLKIIWQFENDHDQAMETYLFICQKLVADDFSILRQFQREHEKKSPKFTTWLYAITRNMCIDAYRARRGRRQIPRTIQRLSKLDRKVFMLYYWNGLSIEEVESALMNTEVVSLALIRESFERVIERAEQLPEASRRQEWRPTIVPFVEEQALLHSTQPALAKCV